MSMAIKHAMNKKAKKMAEGGNASPYEGNTVQPDVSRKEWGSGAKRGTSLSGEHVRGAAMAKEAGQHKAHASRTESAKNLHKEAISNLKNDKQDRTNLAEGGDVDCDDMPDKSASVAGSYSDGGVVDRIMRKRMAPGGEVDASPNEFDELEVEPAPMEHETGANSGDELGNEELDENDHDLISRIMRSRAKKDRMPRPA